ncbi:MAG: cation diffusion facilitator family transporter [Propionibacteriaceae bacterium]|nr:cation diffusion facilitator family transporter [Propionibacteriaceae bacterium]
MSHSSGKKAVLAALGANLAIATMKLVAFALTRASSMLAEAIHSFADCSNQLLLLMGAKSAQKKPDDLHPFGYGRERYLSAFLVSIILFTMGGIFALYEAYRKVAEIREGHPSQLLESSWWWVPLAVLVGAMVAESLSLRTAVKESLPAKGSSSWFRFIHQAKSPELPVILLEDVAALLGLIFALIGVGMTLVTGWSGWDAIGTGLIGVLLIVVAFILAAETRSLLIGESASPKDITAIAEALTTTPGVLRLIHMRTIHLGPEEIMVAAKIDVERNKETAEVAAILDLAEDRVRSTNSMVTLMYLEPDLYRNPNTETHQE